MVPTESAVGSHFSKTDDENQGANVQTIAESCNKGWLSTHAVKAASLLLVPGFATAAGVPNSGQIDFPSERITYSHPSLREKDASVSDILQVVVERIEQLVGSYDAVVIDIEKAPAGGSPIAIIDVSVEGRQHRITKPVSTFYFHLQKNDRLSIEVRQVGPLQKMYFKPFKPAALDDEEANLISQFIQKVNYAGD